MSMCSRALLLVGLSPAGLLAAAELLRGRTSSLATSGDTAVAVEIGAFGGRQARLHAIPWDTEEVAPEVIITRRVPNPVPLRLHRGAQRVDLSAHERPLSHRPLQPGLGKVRQGVSLAAVDRQKSVAFEDSIDVPEDAGTLAADPTNSLQKLLAKPILSQSLQEPPLVKEATKDRLAGAKNLENSTLRHGAYKGNRRFVNTIHNHADESDIRLEDIFNDMHNVFTFSFPFSRVEQQPKVLDLSIRVTIGLVMIVAILSTWLGCCIDIPVLTPGFWMLAVVGLLFGSLSFFTDDGWMLITSVLLMTLATISAVVVGDDPLMMQAFSKEVGVLRTMNKDLERNNSALQARLDELSRVQDELIRVSAHFDRDLATAQDFLKEMEKMVVLQIVTDILNLYFTAPRAEVFASSLVIVPDLVPGFEMDKLVESVRLQGLTMAELATLIDAVVADDPAACTKALEALCHRGRLDESQRSERRDAAWAPWQKSKLLDVQGEVAVVPMASCFGLQIYNSLHLAAILGACVSIFLLTIALVRHAEPDAACAVLLLGLAGGLALNAELLAIVQALRAEVAALRIENARFERSNTKLAGEAAFLGKLGRGFDRLQAEFGGSVERAKEAVWQRNAAVKTSTIAVVAHLFARADRDHNDTLDEEETEAFVSSLELVFSSLPDFDPELVRRKIARDGLRQEHLVPLIELILGAETATSMAGAFP